jgi:hypothetical protein
MERMGDTVVLLVGTQQAFRVGGSCKECPKPNESAGCGLLIFDSRPTHVLIREANVSDSNRRSAVSGVLEQMDREAQRVRLAVIGAAMVEALLMVIALVKIDWKNDTHVLMFVFAVLGYTIIALGLAALGAHVSRVGARVVAALDGRDAP